MSISASAVKELRTKTGAGMMDCKKALSECGGSMDKAVDFLRAKGLADAKKKQARVAAEGLVGSYVHNGKIGVLVEVNCETDFVAKNDEFQNLVKDLGLHIAASDPKFLRSEDMDDAFKEREAAIYRQQLIEEGRPEKMIPKIVEGKLGKLASEVCLYEQKFVKNPDLTVSQLVNEAVLKLGEKIAIRRFVKFNLGEGIEKKQDDLAAEVAKVASAS